MDSSTAPRADVIPAPVMNGAESLVKTLVASEVEVCFTNPGTSEMHFVAALDKVPGMRCVLGLFEGVVTGAADGYFRMAGKPTATLLHLGPGLSNGLANLHNAKRARSGIVNIVGEHASRHLRHDSPLTSDIEGIARPMSDWVRTSRNAVDVAHDGACAVEIARTAPGKIATLILPADTAWNEAEAPAKARAPAPRRAVDSDAVEAAVKSLRKGNAALLLGGLGVRAAALEWAGRIAAATGCRLIAEYNCARMERGAGRVVASRLPYSIDAAMKELAGLESIVLAGAKPPVAFFGYPGKPSLLAPADCSFASLAGVEDDIEGALKKLVERLDAQAMQPACIARLDRQALPEGAITNDGIAAVLAALLPENAIVVDEAVTTGRAFEPLTANAPPHDWLNLMGGAIGWALPASVGAAIAAPARKVIALEGDGSGMYTLQALWTMARENLDVTILVFANRAYKILRGELAGVGAGEPGQRATDMLTIDRPALDWQSMARGLGVEAGQAATLAQLASQFKRGLASEGPYLIEVLV